MVAPLALPRRSLILGTGTSRTPDPSRMNANFWPGCCSASSPDPSGSCEINKLESRSASNSRAGQQPCSGRVSAIWPEPLAVARSPRLEVAAGLARAGRGMENGERRSGRRQANEVTVDCGARVAHGSRIQTWYLATENSSWPPVPGIKTTLLADRRDPPARRHRIRAILCRL